MFVPFWELGRASSRPALSWGTQVLSFAGLRTLTPRLSGRVSYGMHQPTPRQKKKDYQTTEQGDNAHTINYFCSVGPHLTPHLYDAEHSVVQDQRRVVPRDDRPHQNPLDKIPRRHQDVKPVAAVLHTGLQHLTSEGDMGESEKAHCKRLYSTTQTTSDTWQHSQWAPA